ncbi:MAG: hypothetical protein M1821_005537 [Bathelium mastoideum]|nr:MAG: hypothetical protein M1821_005537 [Bathelium mastoideum]KAI9691864.1 MAG: hypothetical protein M1822_007937 [Bathelium mastoideum]
MSSVHGTSLHVTVTIDPRNEAAFLEALKPTFDAVSGESENTFFEVYKNSDKPGQFKLVENWNASKEWLIEVQLQKEYYKPYADATKPMWIEPLKLEFYDRLAPVFRSVKPENTGPGPA